jgi:putative two-component system response regulator
LYRWGGDEFLLVVPSAHATDMLDRLQVCLASAEDLLSPEGDKVRLEVSLGGADYTRAEEIGPAIDRADRDMYLDKGRRKGEPRNTPDHLRISKIATLS